MVVWLISALLAWQSQSESVSWGVVWAWEQNRITLDWSDGGDGVIEFTINTRSMTGTLHELYTSGDDFVSGQLVIAGLDEIFYCATHVTVTMVYNGGTPQVAEMNRPAKYSPQEPVRCTRTAT